MSVTKLTLLLHCAMNQVERMLNKRPNERRFAKIPGDIAEFEILE
jgi:hypothetical protein